MTDSQEEYLKTIYLLKRNDKKVRITDIANKLSFKKPSVTKGIKTFLLNCKRFVRRRSKSYETCYV